MATEAPPAPAPGEIKLGSSVAPLNQRMVDAAAKYVTKGAPTVEVDAPPVAQKPADKPPEPVKQVATPKEPPKQPEARVEPKDEDDVKQGPKELREALKRAKQELADAKNEGTLSRKQADEHLASIEKIRADLASRDEEIEKDLRPRAQRLTEAEKRLEEQQAILRVTNYTASDEWREKYDRPLAAARADVDLLVSQMEVQTPEGNMRPGTWNDFAAVLQAPTLTQATAVAKQIFGPDLAAMVVNKRGDFQSLNRARAEAIKNAELESTKYFERQQASQAQFIEDQKKKLHERFSKYSEAHPETFKPDEKDTESLDALRDGLSLADRIIIGDPKMTPDERIDALVEMRAGQVESKSLKIKLKRREARITELEEQLKQYSSSEPSVGGSTTPQSAPKLTDRESVLEDMKRRAAKYVK